MYSNILVPVAFSTETDGVTSLAVAKKLANKDARITLYHVMEEIPPYALSYISAEDRKSVRDGVISKLTEQVADVPGGHAVIEEGHAARSILEWAGTHEVDLIIMASHQPGLADYFLGSTAARVVRHAHCAVHILR
jgi:nucleotide-binding universal stress UspA family protein